MRVSCRRQALVTVEMLGLAGLVLLLEDELLPGADQYRI